MDLGLQGKVAIVTGAGRGIGRAIVLALAKEGARVAINDIDPAVTEIVAEEVRAMHGEALCIPADATKVEQVNHCVVKTLNTFNAIDILVNNVGIPYSGGAPIQHALFADSTHEEMESEVDVTLWSTINFTRAVINHMIQQRSGRIVNMSSKAAFVGMSRHALYGAGKGAIASLTKNIASEVGRYGITVNTVSPGGIRTTRAALAERMRESNPELYNKRKAFENKINGITALGTLGEPEDVACAVLFLASDAAKYITGQLIEVDGGFPMISD